MSGIPLDVIEGDRYAYVIKDYTSSIEIENIYNVTRKREDYVNPTIDG